MVEREMILERNWALMERQYLEDHGRHCPYCSSPDLVVTFQSSNFYLGTVHCQSCHQVWLDIYDLVGVRLRPEDLS